MRRPYLFIGGPLHAKMRDVERAPIVDPAAPTDGDDAYPHTVVILDHATTYTRRTVAHIDGDTGKRYELKLYCWEGITDPEDASLHMGDAVAHQYFLLKGTVVADQPTQPQHRLIIPGR